MELKDKCPNIILINCDAGMSVVMVPALTGLPELITWHKMGCDVPLFIWRLLYVHPQEGQ